MNNRLQDHLSFPASGVVLSPVAISALAKKPLGDLASSLIHAAGEKGGISSKLLPELPDGRQRAFPTAEGFGASAKGGRGGRVFFVTNTVEGGEGFLRECLEADGPRNGMFRTSGMFAFGKSRNSQTE
jgi:hypothetical protein